MAVTRLRLGMLALVPALAAAGQPARQDGPDYAVSAPNPQTSLPIVSRSDGAEMVPEDPARLAALGFVPFRRHAEVIRYSFSAMEWADGRARSVRQVIVQIAPGGDASAAQLLVVTGRGPLAGTPRVVSRRRETISLEEYRVLRTQLLGIASDLDLREQDVADHGVVCSHVPWARFDMKLGGAAALLLSRTGGCTYDAAAYRAGDFLLVAAERILGQPIEGARPPR